MTSLLDPTCLIEHELYVENAVWIHHAFVFFIWFVENAVWIRHAFSARKCSFNKRLHPNKIKLVKCNFQCLAVEGAKIAP